MTSKQEEEIRQIVAKALSDSILGKAEQSIMDALSPKVARMQNLQAELERAVEKAKTEEAESFKRKKLVEDSFPVLQQKLSQERTKFDTEMATMQKAKDSFQSQLNILAQQVKEAEVLNGRRVREAQEKADKLIAEFESNISIERTEFAREKKAHDEFRKSIGL